MNGPDGLSPTRRAMLAASFPHARKLAQAPREQAPATPGDRVEASPAPARAGMDPAQVSFGTGPAPEPPALPVPPVRPQAPVKQAGKHRQGSGERFPDAPLVAAGEVFGPTNGKYKPKQARNASTDKGETVEALQSVLIAQGFLAASPGADRHYGSRTTLAVGKWQRAFNNFVKQHAAELGGAPGIRVDGVYGPETQGAMQQLNAALRDNPALAATFAELARKVMTAPAPRVAAPPAAEMELDPAAIIAESPPGSGPTVSPTEGVDRGIEPPPAPLPVQPQPEPVIASPPSLPATPVPASEPAPAASRMPLDDTQVQSLLGAIRSYPGVLSVEAGPARIVIEVAEAATTHRLAFDPQHKRVVYLGGQGQAAGGELELKDEGDRVAAYIKAEADGARRKLELGMLPGLLLDLRERLFDHQ